MSNVGRHSLHHPPPTSHTWYSIACHRDDRLGTEDIQLETCNYLAAVSNIVSQQFLVSTNLKHHRHSLNVTIAGPGLTPHSGHMLHHEAQCPHEDVIKASCSRTSVRLSTDQPSVAAQCSPSVRPALLTSHTLETSTTAPLQCPVSRAGR